MPIQERLVSSFLEGLLNKHLHATLNMKHHKKLNQCIHDVTDYDDNYGLEENSSKARFGTSLFASKMEELTKGVM